jgi:hypothetical protein
MKILDLFHLYNGNGFELLNMQDSVNSKINFISRTSQNNGIVATVDEIDVKPFNSGLITVALGGSVLSAFVQNKSFYTAFHIMVLEPKVDMSLEQKLFYCMVIQKNAYRYGYGRQANKTLKDIEIPSVDECNKIIGQRKIEKIKTLVKGKNAPELNIENWKEFYLYEIFDIEYGNKFDLDKMTFENPQVNFVSRTANNCGIVSKVDNIAHKKPYNAECMTIALGGSIGSTFYQNKPFYTAQNVAVLKDKEGLPLSKFVKLFLKTIIELEVGIRFRAFGRELNKHIKRNFSVRLPQASDGHPDWHFMENYIKYLPYSDII